VKYMLDTNVISELQKSNCNQNVKSFTEQIRPEDMYLSVITIGELCYGVEKLPAGKKKHDLYIWLYSKLPEWFNRRIIEIDTEVITEWGKIRAGTERNLPVADSLIAASAITNHTLLVTRNTKDFEDIKGINLLNPWEF
jgi:toxin FitB